MASFVAGTMTTADYDLPAPSDLDYHTDDGTHGLRFELGPDGIVQIIHGGDAGAITFIEGCA